MNILLTGGNDFIGKNILESGLVKKYNFLAPSQTELDLTDENKVKEYFKKNKIDVVIHGACKSSSLNTKESTETFNYNTKMFFNLIDNSSRFKKMIVLSSGTIYGMNFYKPKMTEDYFGTHIPEDENGYSRYVCAEQMEFLDNITELRIFGIFGKYEDCSTEFIANTICKTLFDLPITIKQNKKVDYIYIDDLMPILDYFIQNEVKHFSYNITPDNSIELNELAQKIVKISGKSLPITVQQPETGLEYSGDNTRLKNEIPNLKFTPLDDALSRLYKWYLENKSSINKELLISDK